jgi:hypothetical protein
VPWTNGDLPLFHGTDDVSASAILSRGVDLRRCSPLTDFGRGFYTTTNLEQAKNWARIRAVRAGSSGAIVKGAVIVMKDSLDYSKARLFTIADCDQISFHSAAHVGAGGPLLTGARVSWTEP